MEHCHKPGAGQRVTQVEHVLVISSSCVSAQENQNSCPLSPVGNPVDVRQAGSGGLGIADFLALRLPGEPRLGFWSHIQNLCYEKSRVESGSPRGSE